MCVSHAATAAFVALSLAVCGQAQAQTVAYAVGDGTPNSIPLSIPVTASVGGRCGFATGSAPSGSATVNNFDAVGFDQSFTFKLDCTGKARVGVVSSNGALLTGGSVPSGYTAAAPYDVQLTLVGNTITTSATCGVANLAAAATGCATTYIAAAGPNFRGPAVATGGTTGLELTGGATNGSDSTIRIKANAYAGANIVVAGTYQDTLTITVGVGL